jgi:hypothetical protein
MDACSGDAAAVHAASPAVHGAEVATALAAERRTALDKAQRASDQRQQEEGDAIAIKAATAGRCQVQRRLRGAQAAAAAGRAEAAAAAREQEGKRRSALVALKGSMDAVAQGVAAKADLFRWVAPWLRLSVVSGSVPSPLSVS